MAKLYAGAINGYMDILSYPLELSGLVSVVWVSCVFSKKIKVLAEEISVYTFSIYLFHLPFAIAANYALRKYKIMNYMLPARSIFVIAITVIILFIYRKLFQNNQLFLKLVGLKR